MLKQVIWNLIFGGAALARSGHAVLAVLARHSIGVNRSVFDNFDADGRTTRRSLSDAIATSAIR